MQRITHKAKLVSNKGGISPLCAEKPRKINLSKESWTLADYLVTCEKCTLILESGKETTSEGDA